MNPTYNTAKEYIWLFSCPFLSRGERGWNIFLFVEGQEITRQLMRLFAHRGHSCSWHQLCRDWRLVFSITWYPFAFLPWNAAEFSTWKQMLCHWIMVPSFPEEHPLRRPMGFSFQLLSVLPPTELKYPWVSRKLYASILPVAMLLLLPLFQTPAVPSVPCK